MNRAGRPCRKDHAIRDNLWDLEPPGPDLLKSNPNASMQICYRDNILDPAQTDWMEWQAGYVCGALLMPASQVRELAGA